MFKSPCPACGANLAFSGAKVERHSLAKAKESCPKCGVLLRRKRNWPEGVWILFVLAAVFVGAFRHIREQWGDPAAYIAFGSCIAVALYLASRGGYEVDDAAGMTASNVYVTCLHIAAGALLAIAAILYLSSLAPEASPLFGIAGAVVEIAAWVVAYLSQPKEQRATPGDDSPRIKLPW